MALIADLEPFIALEVPGASTPLIQATSLTVIKEFLSDSNVWKANLPTIYTQVGVASYAMTTTSDTNMTGIDNVRVNGLTLYPTSEQDLDQRFPYIDWTVMQGRVTEYFTRDGGNRITLFRIPSAVFPIIVRAALTLSDLAESYPDFIDQNYRTVLTNGIKARLMAMPDVRWSNPNIAQSYQSSYAAGKDKASVDAFKGTNGTRKRTTSQFL